MSSLWLLVLAGGSGTRFWPRSRALRPKQLLPIAGEEPLINTTIRRFEGFVPLERTLVVTTAAQETAVRECISGLRGVQLLAEPESRNTAPSLVFAMEWLRARDPKATVIVVPADHWITEIPEYLDVMKRAVASAEAHGALCTVGIQPTRPETGYGYIRCGESLGEGLFRVERFVEKPKREVAETMVQSPEYLWNAGMFVWTVDAFFSELHSVAPDFTKAFSQAREASGSAGFQEALKSGFLKAPATSIDYALLEKSGKVIVIPGSSFGWNDLGSFISLEEVYPKCEGGVARADRVLAIDSLANIIDAPGKTVALLGVTDMVLVVTEDVVLLASKERAQEVKKFVERLKKERKENLI